MLLLNIKIADFSKTRFFINSCIPFYKTRLLISLVSSPGHYQRLYFKKKCFIFTRMILTEKKIQYRTKQKIKSQVLLCKEKKSRTKIIFDPSPTHKNQMVAHKRHLVSCAGTWLLCLGVLNEVAYKTWFGLNWGMQHPFGALTWNFRLIRLRKFRWQRPVGHAGDGKTREVSASAWAWMAISWGL